MPSPFLIWCWQMRIQNRMKTLRARKRHWRRKSVNKLKNNWRRLSLPLRLDSREHWLERKRLMRITSNRETLSKNFSSWHASRLKLIARTWTTSQTLKMIFSIKRPLMSRYHSSSSRAGSSKLWTRKWWLSCLRLSRKEKYQKQKGTHSWESRPYWRISRKRPLQQVPPSRKRKNRHHLLESSLCSRKVVIWKHSWYNSLTISRCQKLPIWPRRQRSNNPQRSRVLQLLKILIRFRMKRIQSLPIFKHKIKLILQHRS